MIRFIYIGDQILRDMDEKSREFAFFNTVTDKFIEIGGCYTFSSLKEFEDYARIEWYCDYIDRCRNLIPNWYVLNDPPI